MRLRAARPEDAEAAARLILEPPPSLTLLLGSEEAALRAARASFLAPRSIHSWRHALVADDPEAGVVGLVVAFPGGLWGRYRAPTGLAMARAAPKALPGLVRRGRVLDRLTAPVPEDALHVSTLAVAPGTRGRGIGATLLRAAEAEARRRGLRRVTLDVGSPRARAFYERAGFVATGERHARDRRLVPPGGGTVRMEKGVMEPPGP